MRDGPKAGLVAFLAGALAVPFGCEKNQNQSSTDYTPAPVTSNYSESSTPKPVLPDKLEKAVVFVFDTSGSMDNEWDGVRKIDGAKGAFEVMLRPYEEYASSNSLTVAAVHYPNDRVEAFVPPQKFNTELLRTRVNRLSPSRGTPLSESLQVAENIVDSTGCVYKNVVVLTDGINSYGESPETVLQRITTTNETQGDSRTDFYFVPFNTDRSYFDPLAALGAQVYEASSVEDLARKLTTTATIILEREDSQ